MSADITGTGQVDIGGNKPPSKYRPRAGIIVGIVLVVLGLVLTSVCSYLLGAEHERKATTAALGTSDPMSTNYDYYADYRTKSTYVGEVGSAKLTKGATYYMPSIVALAHTANDEWFIGEANAPLLSDASDAGPYPFKVETVAEPPSYMFDGGSGLQITLPNRLDFQHIDSPERWVKNISPAVSDIRDPGWRHRLVIPVTTVLPAPGFKLADYYDTSKSISTLPAGQSAFIDAANLKLIVGTSAGFLDNGEYTATPNPNMVYRYVRVTNTGHGFTVCTEVPERRGQEIYTVQADYVPLQHQIPVKIAC